MIINFSHLFILSTYRFCEKTHLGPTLKFKVSIIVKITGESILSLDKHD